MELFKTIVGQPRAKLAITDWYLHETQPLLIYGSSGYGKTLFAESLGAKTIDTTQMRGDRLNSILKPIKEAEDGDILFFDEIHSLQPKILEGLYKIIDKGTFYDTELCTDLKLPEIRFIFASNLIGDLPEAFVNRCRMITLQDYTSEELAMIINNRYPEIDITCADTIIRASKGVPRVALSLAKSIIAGAKTDEIEHINEAEVRNILTGRMNINPDTGLNEKEFKILQKVAERGNISTTAVANLIGCSVKDARQLYIEPLRASSWLAVSKNGVILGLRGHENYRIFVKKRE